MTDYNWPSGIVPSTSALTWLDNTAEFRSPLSGTTRTESRPGGRWALTITITNKKYKEGIGKDPLAGLEAFIFMLNGKQHRAVIPDHAYRRSGPGGGAPKVKGGGMQTGLSLSTYGWPANTTVLYAGDRVGVSGQMIPLSEDATTDSSGECILKFAHALRNGAYGNTPIEIKAPTARFILQNKAGLDSRPGIFKGVMLEFEEDVL